MRHVQSCSPARSLASRSLARLAAGLALSGLALAAPAQAWSLADPGPAGSLQPTEQRIAVQVVPVVTESHHAATTSLELVPTLERDGLPLLGAELYQALGRADLTAEYRARDAGRHVLIGVGLAGALGGLIYALTGPSPDVASGFDRFNRDMHRAERQSVTGLVVSLCGLGLAGVGAFTDPEPVDRAERLRLIDEHNRNLGAPSGASTVPDQAPRADRAAPGGEPQADAEAPHLTFQAGLLPGGGMAGLVLTF